MEDNTTFVDDTDYKRLFLAKYDECQRAIDIIKEKEKEIERLDVTIRNMQEQLNEADARNDALVNTNAKLAGKIEAFQFCICHIGECR